MKTYTVMLENGLVIDCELENPPSAEFPQTQVLHDGGHYAVRKVLSATDPTPTVAEVVQAPVSPQGAPVAASPMTAIDPASNIAELKRKHGMDAPELQFFDPVGATHMSEGVPMAAHAFVAPPEGGTDGLNLCESCGLSQGDPVHVPVAE